MISIYRRGNTAKAVPGRKYRTLNAFMSKENDCDGLLQCAFPKSKWSKSENQMAYNLRSSEEENQKSKGSSIRKEIIKMKSENNTLHGISYV